MSNPVELLSLQAQSDMLSKLLENRKTDSVVDNLGLSSDSGGLSFETLLQGYIGELTGDSSGSSSQSNMTALLESMGIYGYPQISSSTPAVSGTTQPTDTLLSFIEAHEGYSPVAYRGADSQNLTIGYGHVIQTGEGYENLTQKQAADLLQSDLSSSVASVNKEFAGTKLTQNQSDSLVSFAYNLGDNIWSSASKLVGDVKSGASADTLKADFTQFDHCNGQELQGLYNRRVDEWSLFTSGTYNLNV
jgi:lysozyme